MTFNKKRIKNRNLTLIVPVLHIFLHSYVISEICPTVRNNKPDFIYAWLTARFRLNNTWTVALAKPRYLQVKVDLIAFIKVKLQCFGVSCKWDFRVAAIYRKIWITMLIKVICLILNLLCVIASCACYINWSMGCGFCVLIFNLVTASIAEKFFILNT